MTAVGTDSHLAGDGPYEAGQLAGHGGGHLAVRLAGMREPPVAAAQAFLGGPGEVLDPGWGECRLALQMARLAGREAIAPGGLNIVNRLRLWVVSQFEILR